MQGMDQLFSSASDALLMEIGPPASLYYDVCIERLWGSLRTLERLLRHMIGVVLIGTLLEYSE